MTDRLNTNRTHYFRYFTTRACSLPKTTQMGWVCMNRSLRKMRSQAVCQIGLVSELTLMQQANLIRLAEQEQTISYIMLMAI